MSTDDRSSGVILAAAIFGLVLTLGCGPSPPDPPKLPDPGATDPEVASRIERAFDEVVRHSRRAAPRAELAMTYHANAFPDLAAVCYEQAIALDDAQAKWWYYLALCRHELGAVEEGLAALDRAMKLEPSFGPLYWRRGLWSLSLDRHGEAEMAFRRAVEIAPGETAGWLGLARTMMRTDRDREAVGILEPLVRRNPDDGYARQLLGRTYRRLGDVEKARIELARGGSSDPSWNDRWQTELFPYRAGLRSVLNGAQQLLESDRPLLAIDLLRPLQASRPDDVTVTTWLAKAYLEGGRDEDALALLRGAEKRLPDHFVVQLQLGDVYGRRGDWDRALAHTDRALELNPHSGPAHLQRAGFLRRTRDHEAAREALRAAVRYDATDVTAWVMLGEVLFSLGRFEEMVETLEHAADRFPHVATPLAGLVFAYGELGRLEEARDALRRAASAGATDPDVGKAQGYLSRLEAQARASDTGRR